MAQPSVYARAAKCQLGTLLTAPSRLVQEFRYKLHNGRPRAHQRLRAIDRGRTIDMSATAREQNRLSYAG